MSSGFESFKNKDFGGIIYVVLSFCGILFGVLLLMQKNISHDNILFGLDIAVFIAGIALVASYFANARSKFRPGWALPMGFVLVIVGGAFMFSKVFFEKLLPNVSLNAVVTTVALFNAALLLSIAIQHKALCLKRWAINLLLSVVSFAFTAISYLNVWKIRDYNYVLIAVFMFVFALQCFLEALYNLKWNYARN